MKELYIIVILLLIICRPAVAQSVGINTKNPSATLHVEGDLRIRSTNFYTTDFSPLVVNEDGLIGKYNGVTNNLFYAQSKTRTVFSSTNITEINGSGYVVPWSNTDIKYNPKILVLNSDNQTFTLDKTGLFEVSGMVSYNPQTTNTINTSVGVNVLIQYLPLGASTWIAIAGTRYFLTAPFNNVAGTINISPAIKEMNKGDQIRILMIRASGVHGSVGTPALEADDFTKMLKVMSL